MDFSTLTCPAGKDDNSCLTAPQLKTVETYYGGVKNSKGELIFSGQALGNAIGAQRGASQRAGGTFDLVRIAYNDPNLDWHKFDLDRDMKIHRREDRLRRRRESGPGANSSRAAESC